MRAQRASVVTDVVFGLLVTGGIANDRTLGCAKFWPEKVGLPERFPLGDPVALAALWRTHRDDVRARFLDERGNTSATRREFLAREREVVAAEAARLPIADACRLADARQVANRAAERGAR